ATLTVTALPMSRHLTPSRAIAIAGLVQFSGKPCSLSASRMSGVTILPSGIQIAGGEGMPRAEPPFNVGTLYRDPHALVAFRPIEPDRHRVPVDSRAHAIPHIVGQQYVAGVSFGSRQDENALASLR